MSAPWPLGPLGGATPRRGNLFRALLLQPPLRLALECCALFLAVAMALTLPVVDSAMTQARAQLDARMLRLALAAAATVDGDLHETIRSQEQVDSDAFRRLLEPLVRFHNAVPRIRNVYTMRADGERLRFVLDTAWSPHLRRASDPPVPVNAVVDFDAREEPGLLPTLRAGRAHIDRRAYEAASPGLMLRSVEAPIRDRAGNVVAFLSLDFDDGSYTARQRAVMAKAIGVTVMLHLLLAGVIGALIHRLRSGIGEALDALTHELKSDGLTGLYNRRYFNRCLERDVERARKSGALSLLVFDADHFKRINDTHGHPAGDTVLQHIAACLRDCVEEPSRAFRTGGEEFAVLLPGLRAADAMALYRRLGAAIRRPVTVDGACVEVTVSGGIAELGSGESGERLLSRADQALYVAKQGGRDLAVIAAPP